MKFENGQRVKFKDGDREATGTVTKTWPAYKDEPAYCDVYVDDVPDWWPYGDTKWFSPEEEALTAIQSGLES